MAEPQTASPSRHRFCVFCGGPPDDKTKEHVLPQWLIELTGPPKRVVNFGVNPVSQKQPRFDWSSFVFPACHRCNERYSPLEVQAKGIVLRLLAGAPMPAIDYVTLLDWLDKVRVGLWLGYYYLQSNAADISPRFHIDTRIGQKDRMLAVYTIATHNQGLNAYGAETPVFQLSPSCFSLNINSLHLLNLSWDFMCAARCGFPYPRRVVTNLDLGGIAEASDFTMTGRAKHPILRQPLIKPAMHLYQPILPPPLAEANAANPAAARALLPGSDRQGLLVRQHDSHVEILRDPTARLGFDEVGGYHARPLKDIIAQTYGLQALPLLDAEFTAADPAKVKEHKQLVNALKQLSAKYRDTWLNLKPSDLNRPG